MMVKPNGRNENGSIEQNPLQSIVQNIFPPIERHFLYAVAWLLFIVIISVNVYHNLEGWDWIKSIYFTSATMTTVGYGDVVPQTDLGRIYTIALMWIGVSTGFYVLTTLGPFRVGGIFERSVDRIATHVGLDIIEKRDPNCPPCEIPKPQMNKGTQGKP
jgi:voltage-gated potassium channel Kch